MASRGPARTHTGRPNSHRKILRKQALSAVPKTANSNTVFGMVKTADLTACSVRLLRGPMTRTELKRARDDHARVLGRAEERRPNAATEPTVLVNALPVTPWG